MEEKELPFEKATIELAYENGKWHPAVNTKLNELHSQGILTKETLYMNELTLFELKSLPYEEALMVLKNIDNKPSEKDMRDWIIEECKQMRENFATIKEKKLYNEDKSVFLTKFLLKTQKKHDKVVALEQREKKRLSMRASRKGAGKRSWIGEAPSGGAAFKDKQAADIEDFHHERVDGKHVAESGESALARAALLYKRVVRDDKKPTTREDPIVIGDSD